MPMLPRYILENISKDLSIINKMESSDFQQQRYNPKRHYINLGCSNYYYALLILRHHIKAISDYYFGVKQGAKNIDLFMLTSSISSPMGPGSDSKPIKIKFGSNKTFLVDSSQFGFEPLLLNNFKKVYCYLPSMRGEDPDSRHLNQFYHCELEMRGGMKDLVPVIEGYIKILCEGVLAMSDIIDRISVNPRVTKKVLSKLIKTKSFPQISFDDGVDLLVKNGKKELVNFTRHGRDIKAKGELYLMKLLKADLPTWITNYDRDRVPFYQKPVPGEKDKVINADLIFSPIFDNGFGGEIVGCGQRQDNIDEMYESLKRQNGIRPNCYEWYIDLRRNKKYQVTSGFGMGIERFIAWTLGKNNIHDVIIYPRLKNVITYP